MTDDPDNRALLRAQVTQAIADYIRSGQPIERMRPSIVAAFPQLPRTTIYKWIKNALETGSAGKRLADTRAPASSPLNEVHSIAALPVAHAMNVAIQQIQRVVTYAAGDDAAKPRNPKLLLASSIALTRALNTAMGLHQALVAAERLDNFNRMLIAEISKESPELAQRVVDRLRAVTSRVEP